MFLTKRCTYGLRALLRLVSVYPGGTMTGGDISKKEDIPKKFLDQLMLALANAGIVRSIKGNHGGYMLNKHPENIRIMDAIVALSGPLIVAECSSSGYSCPRKGECQVQEMAGEVQDVVEKYFRKLNLKQLFEKKSKNKNLEYMI